MHYTRENINTLDKITRINLINSCSGYKSANLIGSISKEGVPNVAVFSSVTHLGSNPPTLGFILRPTTVPRDTYKNIKENCIAPFVKGSPVQMEMKFIEEYHIKSNNVLHIIAEITNLYVNDDILEKDGFIDLSRAKVAAINGLDAYAVSKSNTRFEYQKPKI